MEDIANRALPDALEPWAAEYAKVGHRNAFLWKWCREGVTLTTLPCIDPELRDTESVPLAESVDSFFEREDNYIYFNNRWMRRSDAPWRKDRNN